MENVLEVKNLTKKFGNFTAVDNVSFSIKEGEVLGLLGQNGAGKTTTIQMLLGVMDASFGEIIYFGKPFKEHRGEVLKQINYSSTYISFPWQFTVWENLEVYARLYEVPDRKKRIEKLLKEFELDHLVKRQFRMLSAGEKTRLLLTKAFLNYPKLILLDEPTASLDPDIAVKVREFLKKEKKEYNVSMLFTSHNMEEVEEMCDRIIILRNGKVIEEDTPESLAKRITTCQVVLTMTNTNKAKKFLDAKMLPYEVSRNQFSMTVDEKHVADFLMLLASEKIEYSEIAINKPDLEDFFLQVVNQ